MTNGKPEQALRQTRLRRAVQTLVAVVIVLAFAIAALLTARWDAIVTAAAFSSARGNLTTLRNFLYRMPKGGDLHVHLTGDPMPNAISTGPRLTDCLCSSAT